MKKQNKKEMARQLKLAKAYMFFRKKIFQDIAFVEYIYKMK